MSLSRHEPPQFFAGGFFLFRSISLRSGFLTGHRTCIVFLTGQLSCVSFESAETGTVHLFFTESRNSGLFVEQTPDEFVDGGDFSGGFVFPGFPHPAARRAAAR